MDVPTAIEPRPLQCEADADQALRRPAAARVSLGLDQPFAIRVCTWAFAALQSDLGNSSFSGQSVVSMIAQRIPPTPVADDPDPA